MRQNLDGSVVTLGFPTTTALLVSGLNPGSTTTFRVRAPNFNAQSSLSAVAKPTTLVSPANLTARAISARRVRLDWTDRSRGETGFEIQRRTRADEWRTVGNVGRNVKAWLDHGLRPDHRYRYRVRAVVVGGHSDWCPHWPWVKTQPQ